jgi:tetratricopeptide (TPR) repeat protein
MVAPRKGAATMGPFNWAQVLRHEFTHTVTLAATDNRIAHWFTEGLAVWEEHAPLRWEWVPMLHHAVTKKQLFTMDRLTWGFVRPKKPSDRQLAYAQSYWICKYIEEKHGHDAILKMLAEFKLGASQDDVFPKILGQRISEFEKDFFAWTEKEVAGWGYDADTTKKYDETREKAEELLAAKKFDEALVLWQELGKMRPVDALPHTRLAYLFLKLSQPEDAAKHLIALHEVELKDNRYAKRIARLFRDVNKLDDGVKYATQAVYIDPYDRDAHELLASLYEKSGNEEGLSRERRVISVIDEWTKRQSSVPSPGNPGEG